VALALYSDTFWFPSGVVAANTPARVFPRESTTLAPLWADINGTIPLSNPLDTDGSGVLTFYATVGQYWVHIDSESFLIDVGLSQEQADLSTGIASGLDLNINAGNPQAIDITPFIGYVVDNTDALSTEPTITTVDYPGGTVVLAGAALLRPFTFFLMDSAQTVTQQATYPTPQQFRSHIFLGACLFDTAAAQILEVQTLPTILPQQGTQLVDLMDALGPFSISGNLVSANGANLMFDKSTGVLFARAFNYVVGGVYTDNPHRTTSPAHSPATFRRVIRTVTIPTPANVTTIDPANYDLNGVLTPVGGGTNTATIQRVYLFAVNSTSAQITVQYGQSTYSSLALAVDAVGAGAFVENPINVVGTLIGYLVVIRTATNLSDPAQAVFIQAGKFATP
jgi:hypothetical protein